MHGTDRDADRYIEIAAPVAERYDALAIAIHFSVQAYPRAEDYTLGIYAVDGTRGGASRYRDPEDMLYAELERVFDLTRATLGGVQEGYYVFGHSAGSQFAHRLLTFLPAPRVLGAVAANAGWYTLPAAEIPELHAMPYGLIDGPMDVTDLEGLVEAPLTILLSELDTTSAANDDLVRGTPAAEAQGRNRLERGRFYFAAGAARAAALGADFGWRLDIVPGAGHNAAEVIGTAGFALFEPHEPACLPPRTGIPAPAVAITEILADPPDGSAGDANGDGERDPDEDEFLEIANLGESAVCLAGWTLGDASDPERHRFAAGPALQPGQVRVVFGGGVPTGAFHGARVERASQELSLQNGGDVVTLRDASGAVVDQASWGDCAGRTCAPGHWSEDLGVAASLTRAARSKGAWRIHDDDAGAPFSPGTAP
jgi:hypothetical protein